MKVQLKGRRAFTTGAVGGVGGTAAARLSSLGVDVVGLDREEVADLLIDLASTNVVRPALARLLECMEKVDDKIAELKPRPELKGVERGNQMKTGELERPRASRFIPQNIPHKDPTLHDRTDKERRKTQ